MKLTSPLAVLIAFSLCSCVVVEWSGEGPKGVDVVLPYLSQVTNRDFERQVIQSKEPVLVEFTAEDCQPCETMTRRLQSIAAKQSNLKVFRVMVAREPLLAKRFNIKHLPTVLLFNHGGVVNRFDGVTTEQQISTAVNRLL